MIKKAKPFDESMTKRARKYVSRVRKLATEKDYELSEWEDEFLQGLDERLDKFGKAFCDPDLGAMNAPLSLRQGLKLKEIKKKAIKPEIDKSPKLKSLKPPKPQKPLKRTPFKAKIKV